MLHGHLRPRLICSEYHLPGPTVIVTETLSFSKVERQFPYFLRPVSSTAGPRSPET